MTGRLIAARPAGGTFPGMDELVDGGQPTLTALAASAAAEANALRRIATLRELVVLAEQATESGAIEARGQGASWAAIGRALGISRQAAQQRLGTRVGDGSTPRPPLQASGDSSARPREPRPRAVDGARQRRWFVKLPRGYTILTIERDG